MTNYPATPSLYYNPYLDGYRPKPAAHWLHAVLTLITGGLWLPIWVVCEMVAWRRQEVRRLGGFGYYPDPWGQAPLRYWDGHMWTAKTGA